MNKKHRGDIKGQAITTSLPGPAGGVQLETFIPWILVRRKLKKQVITPLDAPQEFLLEAAQARKMQAATQDTALMRAIGLAHHWQRLLDAGRFSAMTEIAAAEGIDPGQASRMSRLVQLAPDLIEEIIRGNLDVSVSQLLRGKLTTSWQAQRKALLTGLR